MSEPLTVMETGGEDASIVPTEDTANPAALQQDGVERDNPSVGCADTSPYTGEARGALQPTTAEAAMVERLADEYLALCEEVPMLGAFEALPPSVLAEAAAGRTLAEAYFRYAYREKCRIEDERERQREARAAATGSLSGSAVDGGNAAEAAMLRGIWGERL